MKSIFNRQIFIFSLLVIGYTKSTAQDVLMQGWYWDYPKTTAGANWTDTLQQKIVNLADKGISHVWLPPLSRASFGSNSNGYDPKDLFDLGEFGGGSTGLGSRSQLDDLIDDMQTLGIKAVADVVYNHRDGGFAENNPSVEGWIEGYNCSKKDAGENPYPSDRYRLVLPLGGSSMNGAGNYYIKIASASKHNAFYSKPYTFYAQTNTVGFQSLIALTETEPNGGGDCGQGSNTVQLGRDMNAAIDIYGSNCLNGGCGVDEFALTISAGQYNTLGDTLFIYLSNPNGDYTDHFIYGMWSQTRGADVAGELKYQTYTNFNSMPSGRGDMNHPNFRPNGNLTNLNGDKESMLFFYDYDQAVPATRDTLISWTKWLIDDVNIGGLRMDAVKHFDHTFTAALMDSLNTSNKNPGLVVGEFYDFNAATLKGWVDNVENSMTTSTKNVRVFDFALRGALKAAGDQFGYDVRNVFTSGIVDGAGGNADQAVTFVNNHDFRGAGEPVSNNPQLAYAYILSNPRVGLPSIFYPDYYGTDLPFGPDPYLKDEIDNLLDIKAKYIDSSTHVNYISSFSSPTAITYTDGYASTSLIYQTARANKFVETIVAINYAGDTLDAKFKWPKLLAGSNLVLIDQTGRSLTPKVVAGVDDSIRIIIPPQSYAIWVSDDIPRVCDFGSKLFVDANANGNYTGKSWNGAIKNLSSALALSEACSEIEEIWVKEGTYYPNIVMNRDEGFAVYSGVNILGGFPSQGDPTLMDRDPMAYPTILSGNIGSASTNSDNVYHVVSGFSYADTASIDGFTISGGNANVTPFLDEGAGVNNLGQLQLKNTIIQENAANVHGQAISNAGLLLLNNVLLQNNMGNADEVYNKIGGTISLTGSSEIKP